MTLRHYFHQALLNLLSSSLRSFLAVLGILVGTAAVVALLGSGRLATEKALEQFKSLGTDLLAITIFQKTQTVDQVGPSTLPLSFWRQLPLSLKAIKAIAPYSTTYQPISFASQALQGSVIGADDALAWVIKIKMAEGRFISFLDKTEHYVVIGHELAQQIRAQRLSSALGQQLRIGKVLFTIIGIVEPWEENGFFNEDINHAVIIPILAMPLISSETKLNNVVLKLKENSPIDKIVAEITRIIESQAPKLYFFPRSAKQIIESMESQGKIFTLLLSIIGGISLLVGGIGVMNVMLVSVTERKREIGIRKAVGARHRDIYLLFLSEAVILSFLGGGLGVVLGLVFTWLIAWFNAWTFHFYLLPSLAGFAVSVLTGLFFGFYPAKRAAQLEPIVSLRSD